MRIIPRLFVADNLKYADIHSHVLYGIDDGAKDIDESVEMIRCAGKSGVNCMAATPHVSMEGTDGLLNEASKRFDILRERVEREGIDVKLVLGAEVPVEMGLADAVKKDRRLTIGGNGKHMLVEMPSNGIPPYAEKVIFELLASGVVPVWAHPERCIEVAEDPHFAGRFAGNGVLLQVNSGSLMGIYGRRVNQAAEKLLSNGYGDVMASDAHRTADTQKVLSSVLPRLIRIVGREKAVEMCSILPARITGNQERIG